MTPDEIKLVNDTLVHVVLASRRGMPIKHDEALAALRAFEKLARSSAAAEEAIR